ncbi:hypothetical protein [Nostoc punctiforme]|uniref:Uncharacterized protein n=1 Tax=Nostoc punctiforme (strain ATCC 29133 / PCC 73102) TaxID=63737 RepID=B2JAI4_NOSP7|nr:hypothetical protein [Nostoc punctiforme]ACC84938.1 hypothetical protein Npun_AF052 [Nostoc punctiforme PCC 73102]
MSNTDANFQQLFPPTSQVNKDNENPTLSVNHLTPTDDQIKDWLQSPQIKQWLRKLLMGIPNNLKVEAINTIIKNVIQNPDKDYQVQFGSSTIGVYVLRWQLWAAYKLPYASGIKTPDCPYTLKKHLDTLD